MDILKALTESQNKTLPIFHLDDEDLFKTYEPGKWNVKQILVHLADAESVLLERIKRIIAEPKQVLWVFHQDLWNEKLDYLHFPLHLSSKQFSANREIVIFLAGRYYGQYGHLEFVHSETGLRTLKNEFDKVADHNFHHLRQIEKALSKK